MCIICLEVMNEKMKPYEAQLALVEMKSVLTQEHINIILSLLDSKKSEVKNEN